MVSRSPQAKLTLKKKTQGLTHTRFAKRSEQRVNIYDE